MRVGATRWAVVGVHVRIAIIIVRGAVDVAFAPSLHATGWMRRHCFPLLSTFLKKSCYGEEGRCTFARARLT